VDIEFTDTSNVATIDGSVTGEINGEFKAKSSPVPFSFVKVNLKLRQFFSGDAFDFLIVPGLVAPSQGHQDVGEIIFPFAPDRSDLAFVNAVAIRDTQTLAKTLVQILRMKETRVSIDLLSEWRGEAPTIPVGEPDKEPRVLVTEVNGRVFKKPVPRNTPADVKEQDRKNKEILQRSQARFAQPIPLLSPAQKLLKIFAVSGIAKDFPQRLVKDVFAHGIVSGKAGDAVDGLVKTLERFSLATITELETGNLLRRLVSALQRAGQQRFHFDTVAEEAAVDAAAACTMVFLAGAMAKNNAEPRIAFNYWHNFSFPDGSTETRRFVKVSITAGK